MREEGYRAVGGGGVVSLAEVKRYFDAVGLGERVREWSQSIATVELAAEALGCEPRRIAKTMSLLRDEEILLIVTAGDAKIDNRKYKGAFHKKLRMIPGDLVGRLTGHEPGGVCAFALPPDVGVYLDVSLKRFDVVYSACGSANSTIALTLDELAVHSASLGWVDVCTGWTID